MLLEPASPNNVAWSIHLFTFAPFLSRLMTEHTEFQIKTSINAQPCSHWIKFEDHTQAIVKLGIQIVLSTYVRMDQCV